MARFFYFVAWVAALWQLWQGVTVGCFSIGRLAITHCFTGSPFLYLFDFAVVLLFVIGLPFLFWFSRFQQKREDATGP
ncbi:MAG: hypothetical protein DYG89_46755 [Caldilinea sp. CFX5]|nr:hypothetical protein [Caldilinea sp. CFX5]